MKIYIHSLLFLCLLGVLASCEDFLDRVPLDRITDKGMQFSKGEMELYCNTYYTLMPGFESIIWADNSSDNLISGDYNYNGLLSGTAVVPASGGGWSWSGVRSVNYFLNNYQVTKESWSDTKQYVGEILFWRAWYYYSLLKQFGDLPWYDKSLEPSSEELYAPRLSRSVIADSIIQDLTRAAEYLPTIDKAEPLRLHKDAALTFLSRVALYEGAWEKYHAGTAFGVEGSDYNRFFRKAKEAALEIMNSGRYDIASGTGDDFAYWDLFRQLNLTGNNEVILWRKYDFSQQLTHEGQNRILFDGVNTGVSRSLVDSYLCIDGKPTSGNSNYQGDNSVENVIKNRDPRLKQSIFVPGHPRIIRSNDTVFFSLPFINMSGFLRNTTGYQQYKHANPVVEPQGAGAGSPGATTAAIIFRYAEVLLNYAEAAAELGECTQADLDKSINLLRDKVSMPHMTVNVGFTDPKWDFPGLSPLLNEIRRERRVELAFEGFRFDDLMRWAATDVIKRKQLGAKYAQFEGKPFEPALSNLYVSSDGYLDPWQNTPANEGWNFDPAKNFLMPLPTNELVINTNLKQNPGYDN